VPDFALGDRNSTGFGVTLAHIGSRCPSIWAFIVVLFSSKFGSNTALPDKKVRFVCSGSFGRLSDSFDRLGFFGLPLNARGYCPVVILFVLTSARPAFFSRVFSLSLPSGSLLLWNRSVIFRSLIPASFWRAPTSTRLTQAGLSLPPPTFLGPLPRFPPSYQEVPASTVASTRDLGNSF